MSKAAGKSMALSAAVLGPGLLLLALGQVMFGTIWLFVGSFAMVAWTYRRPWRLGLASCLIPPIAAGLCYMVQLILFANAQLPFLLVFGGVLAGCAAGWIRAQTHEVYLESGQYFAQRSIAYLAIWAAAFGVTQLLGLLASNVWLIRAGLVTGAFSTAMLAVVSIVVLRKRAIVGAHAAALLFAAAVILAPSPLYAQFASDRSSARDLLADAAGRVVLHSNPGQVFPLGAPQISGTNDTAMAVYRTRISSGSYVLAVTLSRHASTAAAQPTAVDLRNLPVAAQRTFEGAPLVLAGRILGGPAPGPRIVQTAGATARENFRIATHVDFHFTNTASSAPGGGFAGSAAGLPGTMMDSFARVGTMTLTEQMTARYARQLRLDGSLVSARPTPPPVVQPTPAPRVTQPPPAPTPQLPQWAPLDASSQVVQQPVLAPPDLDESGPDKDDLAATAAIIAAVLVAAGIAANIAQSIAIAIASAAQSGVELTAEQIQGMVGKGMWDTVTGDRDVEVIKRSKPPPLLPDADIDRPPPPSLIDPLTGRLIATNDKGQYLVGGRWVDLAEARGLIAAGKELKGLLGEAGRWIGNVGLGGDSQATADDAGRLWRRVNDIEREARARGHATPGDIGKLKSLIRSVAGRGKEEGEVEGEQAARDQMKTTAAEAIFWGATGAIASAGGTAFVAGSRLGPALSETAWGTAGGFLSGGAMGGISSSTGRGEEIQIGEVKVGDTNIPVKIAVPKLDLTTARDAGLGAVYGGSTSYSGSGGGMARTMGSGALGGASESITRQAIEGEGIDPSAVAQDAVTGALSQGGQSLIENNLLKISKPETAVDPSRISRRTSVPRDSGDHYTGPSQRTPASRAAASSPPEIASSRGGPARGAAHQDIDYDPRVGPRPGPIAQDVGSSTRPHRQSGHASVDPEALHRNPGDNYGREGVSYGELFRSNSQTGIDPEALRRNPGDNYGHEGVSYDELFRSHSQIDPADLRRNPGEAYGHEGIPFDDVFRSNGGDRS
ncbi:MAG: hypothetical protein AB7O43_17835 [Hyphomicrobiaceae bacterium]